MGRRLIKIKGSAIIISIIVLLWMGSALCAESAPDEALNGLERDRVFATADNGIAVTGEDIRKMKAILDEMHYHGTPVKYRNSALEVKLFAAEARRKGLDVADNQEDMSEFEAEMELAKIYFQDLVANYPLSDAVIESYQRSHPDEFSKYNEESGRYELKPLDAVRDEIHEIIMTQSGKQHRVRLNEFDRLKKAYNARLCDLETGCKE